MCRRSCSRSKSEGVRFPMMKIAQSNYQWISQSNFGYPPNLFRTHFSKLKCKTWYNGGGASKHYPHDVTQNKTLFRMRWRMTINRGQKSDFCMYKKSYKTKVTCNKTLLHVQWRKTKYSANKWRTTICMTTKVKKIKLQHAQGVVQQIVT